MTVLGRLKAARRRKNPNVSTAQRYACVTLRFEDVQGSHTYLERARKPVTSRRLEQEIVQATATTDMRGSLSITHKHVVLFGTTICRDRDVPGPGPAGTCSHGDEYRLSGPVSLDPNRLEVKIEHHTKGTEHNVHIMPGKKICTNCIKKINNAPIAVAEINELSDAGELSDSMKFDSMVEKEAEKEAVGNCFSSWVSLKSKEGTLG
ncbi:hypothetical protein GQR58_014367 [Nymphon striatum]|nr:hypothetical protein GQR58_014367 [Nymphon striatum]